MKVLRNEYHQVKSVMSYDIPDEAIIEKFGSVEAFVSASDVFSDDHDAFYEFLQDYDYDREDDWWTDRKGGYDVDYEFEEE
jgi:hypothetical protein